MREYFCAYHSMLDATRKLSDAEVGRLFRGLLHYSATGEQPDNLQGREEIVFDIFSQQIDREVDKYNAACERNKRNGASRTDSPPVAPSRTDSPRLAPARTQSRQEEEKEKEEDKDKEDTTPYSPPQGDALPALAYAAQILPHLTPKQSQELASFSQDLPAELITHALDIAADNSRSWAYVKAILNRYLDEGVRTLADAEAQEARRRQIKKNGVGRDKVPNPALDYAQRDNSTYENYRYFDPDQFLKEAAP